MRFKVGDVIKRISAPPVFGERDLPTMGNVECTIVFIDGVKVCVEIVNLDTNQVLNCWVHIDDIDDFDYCYRPVVNLNIFEEVEGL